VALTVVDLLAKFKECSFIHSRNIEGDLKNFKKGHVIQTTPFQGKFFTPGVNPAILDPFAKFEERCFIHTEILN